MSLYIIRRLARTVLTLVGVSTVVFVLVQAAGDPIVIMLSETSASPEDVSQLRHRLGLDEPPVIRYLHFLVGAIRGDMGVSIRFNQDALPLVAGRLPATIELAVAALAFSLAVAVPVGILSGTMPGSLTDHVGRVTVVLGQSIPLFWLGSMLVLVFAVELHWLPPSSRGGWQHLVLPAITLGLYPAARIARMLRGSMLEVLTQDYIRVALAKGLSTRRIVLRHALKNAALPVITIVGLTFGTLLGGAVITESIFAWPGVGLLSVQAIGTRDFPLVQALVLVVSLAFVLINLAVDLLYSILDPRIRYG